MIAERCVAKFRFLIKYYGLLVLTLWLGKGLTLVFKAGFLRGDLVMGFGFAVASLVLKVAFTHVDLCEIVPFFAM